jgi:hypothetical protein
MATETIESYGAETPRGHWRFAFTWTGLLAAAYVVYELTRQPALGVAALCLKFGWEDFKTARWLRRFDPRPARGRTCWWMYVSWALLKVVVAAFGLNVLIALAILFSIFVMRFPAVKHEIELAAMGALITFVVGISLCFATTLGTLKLASRHGIPLWLNSSVSFGRRTRAWPPFDPTLSAENQLVLLVSTLTLCVILPAFMLAAAFPEMRLHCFCLLGVAYLFFFRMIRAKHVQLFANSPAECWPPDELAAESFDSLQ